MVEESKEAKKSIDIPIDKLTKSETVNVFMFVISSPVRIVGAVVLGIFAMLFGIFVYPGNEKIQNVILKRLDDSSPVAEKKSNTDSSTLVASPSSQTTPRTPNAVGSAPVTLPVAPSSPARTGEAAPLMNTPAGSTPPATLTPTSQVASSQPAPPPSGPPTARHQSVDAALRSIWPNGVEQRIKQALDLYANQKPGPILAVSTNGTTFWTLGSTPNISRARDDAADRCFLLAASPCFIVAEDSIAVLPIERQAWRPHVTAAMAYVGRFDGEMIPGLRRDVESNTIAVDAYARGQSTNRALVIDPRGIVFSALSEPSQKAAEAAAFFACETKTEYRPKVCILYAMGDRIVLSQRVLSPRN